MNDLLKKYVIVLGKHADSFQKWNVVLFQANFDHKNSENRV